LPCTYTYVWTWLAMHHWTGMLAASIDGDITPMNMLCARGCTRRTLQGVSHGCTVGHAVAALAASCQALPFPCCLGSRRHASHAKNRSHPSHPTQHIRVTMTSDPTTPLPLLKRSACMRACAAFETGYSIM
jgi:hypothetical protein